MWTQIENPAAQKLSFALAKEFRDIDCDKEIAAIRIKLMKA